MSLSLSIHPLQDDLHMYGELDASSAYSLSGQVSVSVASYYSLFESRRTARFMLQSLELTFEGQSEIYSSNTGYSSLRLCSITRQLAPPNPIELSNQGYEDDADPCTWHFVFNLPIPGWLPASTRLCMGDIGICYGLYATAKFTSIDEDQPASYFATLCAPFRSRVKSAEATKQIKIRRFISPPQSEVVEPSTLSYLVNSTAFASPGLTPKARIPGEILSKIQVIASVPEYTNVKDNSLLVILRLRTKDLCEEECKKIQVTEVGFDLVQEDICRYRPSASCLAQYPLPPKRMQPPNLPLRDPHPVSSMYDVGLYVSNDESECLRRSFSLLHPSESGRYKMADNNYAFINDARTDVRPTWYTIETVVPFVHHNTTFGDDADRASEWAGPKNLRPTLHSPLYSVTQDISVALTCTYDLEGRGGKVAKEKLCFRIPMAFMNVAPRQRVDPSRCSTTSGVPALTPRSSELPILPAYSQLYDSNGQRKVDYSTPLPLYTPHSSMPTTESQENLIDRSSEPASAQDNVYDDERIDVKINTPILLSDVESSGSAQTA